MTERAILLAKNHTPDFYQNLLAQIKAATELAELGEVIELVPEGFPDMQDAHVWRLHLSAVQKQIKEWQQIRDSVSTRYGMAGDPFRKEEDQKAPFEGVDRMISIFEEEEAEVLKMLADKVQK